jgi:hypothetical protein
MLCTVAVHMGSDAAWAYEPDRHMLEQGLEPAPRKAPDEEPRFWDQLAELDHGLLSHSDRTIVNVERPPLAARLVLAGPAPDPWQASRAHEQTDPEGLTFVAASALILLMLSGAAAAVFLFQNQVVQIVAAYAK